MRDLGAVCLAGLWVGDCFVYNNSAWRLNYCVGGEVTVMYHLDRPMYLLGYLTKESKVFLMDKDYGVISYALNLSIIEYKTLVLRGELEAAQATLARVPKVHTFSHPIPSLPFCFVPLLETSPTESCPGEAIHKCQKQAWLALHCTCS